MGPVRSILVPLEKDVANIVYGVDVLEPGNGPKEAVQLFSAEVPQV